MIRRWWFWVSLFLALLGMGFIGESAFAQTTAVTAPSGSIQMGGVSLAQGKAVFVPVDAYGHPIAVTLAGGGLNVPGSTAKPVGYSCTISGGAISGCSVPDQVTASPSGFRYSVTISDTTSFGHPTSGMSYMLTGVTGVTGASFRLDQYAPSYTVPTTAALTFTQGSGAPVGACTSPALYTDSLNQVLYICARGLWVGLQAGGDTGGTTTTSTSTASVGSIPTSSNSGATQTIGTAGPGTNTTGVAGVATIAPYQFTQSGVLNSVSVTVASASAGATLTILIGSGNAYSSSTVAAHFTVTVASAISTPTVLTWNAGTDYTAPTIAAGQYLGVWMNSNALIGYSSSDGGPGFVYYTGDPTSGSPGWTSAPNCTLDLVGTVSGASVLTNTAGASNVAVMTPYQFTTSGTLTSVSTVVSSATAGEHLTVLVGSGSSFSSTTVAASVQVTVPSNITTPTVLTWNAPADFVAPVVASGQYLGIWMSNGALIGYNAGDGGPGFAFITGDPTSGTPSWSVGSNSTIALKATVTTTTTSTTGGTGGTGSYATTAYVSSALTRYVPHKLNANRTSLWSESFSGSSLPTGWTAASGWAVNNGLTSPSSGQGWSAQASLAQHFSVERRTSRLLITPMTSGTTFALGWNQPGNGNIDGRWGTAAWVNSGAGTINIGGFDGSNAPSAAASSSLGFSVVTGRQYVFTVIQNQRVVTATLTDSVTGAVASVSAGNNSTDGGGAPSFGAELDTPAIVAVAGQFTVAQFSILANAVNPHVMLLGDSITYGYNLPLSQRWATLLAATTPSVLVSARPGGNSIGVLSKIGTEVLNVHPDILLILDGTNDCVDVTLSAYEANMTAAVQAAQSAGIQVVVGILPPASGRNVASENAFLLTLTGVTFVRFDYALTTGNDGVTANGSLYQADGVHPNQAGNVAMYNQILADAPLIAD